MHFDSHQRTCLNLFCSAVGCSVGDSNSEKSDRNSTVTTKEWFSPLREKKKKRASTQSRTCPVAELHRPVPRLLLVQKMIIVLVLQKMTSFCVIAKHGCKIVRLERSPCSRVFRDVIRNPDVYPWHFDLSVGFCLTAAPEIKSVLFSYWQKWEKSILKKWSKYRVH